jgi:hypothetical protein
MVWVLVVVKLTIGGIDVIPQATFDTRIECEQAKPSNGICLPRGDA